MAALTHTQLLSALEYLPETGVFVRRKSASNQKAGTIAGHLNRDGYVYIHVLKRCYIAHRLAWFYMHGEWPEREIDHANGVKSDNRFLNLRLATRSQNMRNIGVPSHNTTGFKGVCWDRANQKWLASIQVNRKHINLGRFATAEEAAEAYEAKAKEVFGEFHRPQVAA